MEYGVSWYPEHKTAADFQHDLDLLGASGFTVVRMAEFAWTCLEPEEGRYTFDWLDQAIDALGDRGIRSILCTPTACPPAWLSAEHPDILYMDNRGVRRPHGGRRSYCYSHPVYREHAARIGAEMARRYGRHPHVIGFQLDNEPAQEGTGRCHCPVCQDAFRIWLKRRFGSVEALNQAGGMAFWNQTYTRFDQVALPVNTIEVQTTDLIQAYFENPSLRLWAERFASEQQIEFQNIQVRAMRPETDKPITTNATGLATNSIDAYASCRTLDFYAFDYYPSLLDPISVAPYAFARGVKRQPFWLLEFVSGGGHRLSGSGRSQAWPGALQQSVVHAAANDASLVAHFQFRTFPFGAEQLNYAIVDADGVPRRRFRECSDTAEVLRKLSPWLDNSALDSRVALLFDYDALWALHMKPVNPDFTPLGYLEQLVRELASFGVSADILDARQIPETPKQYRLVVLPALIVFDRESQARLKAYAASGGHVVASFLTSVKNRDNVGYTEPLPSGLQDLFGLAVAEVDPVFPHTVSAVETTGVTATCGQTASWLECLELDGAEAWAVVAEGFRRGAAVVARNRFGAGQSWYCGTRLSGAMARAFWQTVLAEAALLVPELTVPLPEGCQLLLRTHRDGTPLLFAFNFTRQDQSIALNGSFTLAVGTQLEQTALSPALDAASCAPAVSLDKATLKLGPFRWALLRSL